jgi:hypothetical protein
VGDFKYYVGLSSLTEIASRDDRVCVLNILGGESSEVTPVSHAYSGGNVVFGTAPGKGGAVLETPIGNIPVYNNVRDGLAAGPPLQLRRGLPAALGARDGVAETDPRQPDLRKIFIITEKIAVHDAREIRAMGQQNGIDIFGANGLGVADSWNQVRIGGALGGDKPGDSLRPGLDRDLLQLGRLLDHHRAVPAHGGLGHHHRHLQRQGRLHPLRAPEFAFALANDARSKAAVPVLRAGRLLRARRHVHQAGGGLRGRPLEEQAHARGRPCRRDGGGTTIAQAKERWFMEKFGVDAIFTPEQPVFSAKGALVTNIAHIPAALTAVMRANATLPDFAPEGHAGAQGRGSAPTKGSSCPTTAAAGRGGARALQRAGGAAQHADRRRCRASDEGRFRRLADGREARSGDAA